MTRTESASNTNEQPGTRDRLMSAMIKVVGSEGLHAASVRTIARAAGCNEAVLYQHFPSKLAMQQAIFEEIMQEMAAEKQQIVQRVDNPADLIDEWVAATYRYYDARPYAFAYVYLSYPPVQLNDPSLLRLNSKLFQEGIESLSKSSSQEVNMSPATFSTFRAGLLGPPRDIHTGVLQGDAVDYAKDVAEAGKAILLRTRS